MADRGVRIVSDGFKTRVLADGVEIPGVVGVRWSQERGCVPRAVIEVTGAHIDAPAMDVTVSESHMPWTVIERETGDQL